MQAGSAACMGGQPGQCVPGTPSTEVCNNEIDEDCNGADLACPVIAITITSPGNLSVFNRSPVAVSGTVAAEAVAATCNGVSAAISSSSFNANVPLREGNNTITCVAQDTASGVGTASIQITLDTTPPTVVIESPRSGLLTTEPAVTVVGAVNDMVTGTVNGEDVTVSCNSRQATVQNRTFTLANLNNST